MTLTRILRATALHLPRLGPLPLLAGLTLLYALISLVVAPADDELYYWCWAQKLQWSYYDHPAMTAVMIRIACEFFGDSLLALRLPACLASATCAVIILHLTQPRRVAWWLLVTPAFSIGACIVTPDTPLILFWAVYLLWLVTMHERLHTHRRDLRMWILGGIILGCGLLGKYTMALAIPAGGLAFLIAAPIRQWFVGYVLHGFVAFVVALPILIFNIQNDFAPLLYQWKHSMGTPAPSLKNFGNFMGIQLLLFGTMPMVLFPWVLANAPTLSRHPRLRVCLCLYGFPYAFFLYKATQGHLEGNWALASYIGFWPLAAAWYERHQGTRYGEWGLRGSFLIPGLASLFALVHSIVPLPLLGPQTDRVTRQAEKNILAAQIAHDWKSLPPAPLFTDTYQWVALLRFHGVDARQYAGVSRPSHFTHPPEVPQNFAKAYLLWSDIIRPEIREGLNEPIQLKAYPLDVRGTRLTTFYLWEVQSLSLLP